MMVNIKSALLITIVLLSACDSGPKVISASGEDSKSDKSSGIFSDNPAILPDASGKQPLGDELHTVTVIEVLPTSKYNYINVNEGDEQFWIAARKQDVIVGETYLYKGGLLKTNYESKEHNRLLELSLQRATHFENTLEKQAEQEALKYKIILCTLKEDGSKVWNTMEELMDSLAVPEFSTFFSDCSSFWRGLDGPLLETLLSEVSGNNDIE